MYTADDIPPCLMLQPLVPPPPHAATGLYVFDRANTIPRVHMRNVCQTCHVYLIDKHTLIRISALTRVGSWR